MASAMQSSTDQFSAVLRLEDEDEEKWDAFVRQSDDATFYHLSGWRRVIGDFLGHSTFYLYIERDGEIAAILPLARVRSFLFGDALISLPFLVYGGPVGSAAAVDLLVQEAVSLAESLQVDYLELRNRSPLTDWPAKDNYVTFQRPIEKESEANLLAIPRKQRAVVRKAIKCGLTTDMDSNADRLHDVLSECKRNLGTPFFSGRFLQFIKDTFEDDCEILIVKDEDTVVAGVMSFIFRNEILPYYGGGGRLARGVGGNDFMYWKVMERACESGLEVFDFGRSQRGTGAYRFKRFWGFEPQTLSYEYHLVKSTEVPKLDPSNSRYSQLINLWTKLPLPMAKVIGPPIARLLG